MDLVKSMMTYYNIEKYKLKNNSFSNDPFQSKKNSIHLYMVLQ